MHPDGARSHTCLRLAQTVLLLGVTLLVVGIAWAVAAFFYSHPWLVLIAMGFALCGIGSAMLITEIGLLPLLASPAQSAVQLSTVEAILGIKAAFTFQRDAPNGKTFVKKTASTDGEAISWLANLSRLATIIWMEPDEELVREFVADLDPEFRACATAPIISTLPKSVQWLLMGREGMEVVKASMQAQAQLSSPSRSAAAVANGMSPRWLRFRTPTAFAKTIVHSRLTSSSTAGAQSAASANAPSPCWHMASASTGDAGHTIPSTRPRSKRAYVASIPLRMAQHRFVVRPYRRIEAYLSSTVIWSVTAWLLQTSLSLAGCVLRTLFGAGVRI